MPPRGRRARRLFVSALIPALVASGCAAHEAVGRPPSANEIERINQYAREHGALAVEYVKPLPACGGGACQAILEERGLPDGIAAIVSSDSRETVVVTAVGRKWNLAASEVAGVSARDRGQGALVGAGIGAGVGLAMSLLMVALFAHGGAADGPEPAPTRDAGDAVALTLLVTAIGAVGGLPWGYLIGGRRSFDFAAPATRATPGGGDIPGLSE